MAWPDTPDFPAGWSFPVGFDGTDYDGSWVLDVPNAKPGEAAALRAEWASNGWAVVQTASLVCTNASGVVSVSFKFDPGFDGRYLHVLFFDDESNLIECSGWTLNYAATGGGYTSVGFSASEAVVSGRYTLVFAIKEVFGSDFYIGDVVPTNMASAGWDTATLHPITTVDYPPVALPDRGWPLIGAGGLPVGWSLDTEPPSDLVSFQSLLPYGANGSGSALSVDPTFIDSTGAATVCYTFTEVLPPYTTVRFNYKGYVYFEEYKSLDGGVTFDEYVEYQESVGVGWHEAMPYTTGADESKLLFYSQYDGERIPVVIEVLGPRYSHGIDDLELSPVVDELAWGSEEVGMIVGGVFRWEPTVIVDDSATAAESVLGVPYTGWFTDPEWPIWHGGSPTYLLPGDPGTAWDFLDDVAYGDQDYGVGVSGTVVFQNSASLDDLATITDELDAPNEPVLEGRAIAFDQHEPLTIGPSLAVLAAGDELASLSVVASLTIDQDVLAVEVPTLQFTATVEDVASADEVATGTTAQVAVSAGVADQDVIPGAAVALLLVEDAQAVELVEPGAAAVVEGEAAAAEDAAPGMSAGLLVVDEAQALTEVGDQAEATPAVLEGMAGATDELLAQVTSAAALESAAVAEDLALYAQPGAVALVMNTETAAVSWYENWQFTDMAQVGNTVLAIGPEGLAVLGGNTDAGDRISASLAWGYRDFGSEQKKRVDSFWFGYSASGLLQVGVQTFGQGYGRFVYRMENRQATKGRNNRVTPGKGLNARYWKVDLSNVSGCAFDVDSMGVDLLNSTRRI